MRFFSFLSDWSRHSTLLATGLFCYVALLGLMICAIVSLIPSQQWPAPTRQSQTPVAITIPVLDLVIDQCIQNTATGMKACDAETRLEAIQEQLRKRRAEYLRSSHNGTGNLLWAPPGTIFAVADSLPSPRPALSHPVSETRNIGRNQDGSSANAAWSTLASR